jgi:hypothetical protein
VDLGHLRSSELPVPELAENWPVASWQFIRQFEPSFTGKAYVVGSWSGFSSYRDHGSLINVGWYR